MSGHLFLSPKEQICSPGLCFVNNFQVKEGAQACLWAGPESYTLRKLERVSGEAEVT